MKSRANNTPYPTATDLPRDYFSYLPTLLKHGKFNYLTKEQKQICIAYYTRRQPIVDIVKKYDTTKRRVLNALNLLYGTVWTNPRRADISQRVYDYRGHFTPEFILQTCTYPEYSTDEVKYLVLFFVHNKSILQIVTENNHDTHYKKLIQLFDRFLTTYKLYAKLNHIPPLTPTDITPECVMWDSSFYRFPQDLTQQLIEWLPHQNDPNVKNTLPHLSITWLARYRDLYLQKKEAAFNYDYDTDYLADRQRREQIYRYLEDKDEQDKSLWVQVALLGKKNAATYYGVTQTNIDKLFKKACSHLNLSETVNLDELDETQFSGCLKNMPKSEN